MRAIVTAISFIILFTGCTLNVQSQPAQLQSSDVVETEKLAPAAFRSVGKVYATAERGVGEMSGTAWAYTDNLLITAGHVCSGLYEMQVLGILEKNIHLSYVIGDTTVTRDDAEILEIDASNDLCLMRLNNHGLNPLPISDYSDVHRYDNVTIVGAPLGFLIYEEHGKVVDISNDVSPLIRDRLIVSVSAAGGNSGSPILNDKGEVIGVLSMGSASGFDKLSICIRSNKLLRFLKLVGH